MLFFLLLSSCQEVSPLESFPLKKSFKMGTEDFSNAGEPSSDFMPYLHPFARIEMDGQDVILGFIPFAEEYVEGVAYAIDSDRNVKDSIVVSFNEPPQKKRAEMKEQLIIITDNGIIENETGYNQMQEWSDTVFINVENNRFLM